MLPFILGIGAAVSSAITAGQAAVIGAGIGAATVAGAGMLSKKQNDREFVPDSENDGLEELVESIVRRRLKRIGSKNKVA